MDCSLFQRIVVLIGLLSSGGALADGPAVIEGPPSPGPRTGELANDGQASDIASLEREVRLETVLRLALARNPDLHEARERALGAAAGAPSRGRLPDLEFKYEQWGVPLRRPFALGEASTLMFGLRQTFPAPGSLSARSRAAQEDAHIAVDNEHTRELEVTAQVRRAYYEYFRAESEYRIHLEHVDIASRVVQLARALYQAGRGNQLDVLRTIVELSRLHNDVATIEQQRQSAKALLNSLMARAPDAPLGPPVNVEPSEFQLRFDELERKLEAARPELVAAERSVRRGEATLDAAKRSATWPAFMVGADYWYMPTAEMHHAYGAMFTVSLPWLNARHREEVREAEHTLAAERRALQSVRNAALYQLTDAIARYEAARESFTIIDRDLLRQAREAFQAAQSSFSAGQGDVLGLLDSLRSYLQVRLEHSRAVARLESSLADVERAVGTDVRNLPNAERGEHRHD